MKGLWSKTKKKEYLIDDVVCVVVACDEAGLFDEYVKACKCYGKNVFLTQETTQEYSREYMYAPKEEALTPNQFKQIVLTLLHCNYDFIVASNSLEDFPKVGAKCIEDVTIYSSRLFKDIKELLKCSKEMVGRFSRIPETKDYDSFVEITDVFRNVQLRGNFEIVSGEKQVERVSPRYDFAPEASDKKMVFVLPIFMAVGGVERNTIEIMRALKDDYEFCVITMERHTKGQGSLNYQIQDLCVAHYDMCELVDFSDYLECLRTLKLTYCPNILWLCNNSPWLEDNMIAFRDLFDKEKIVAQDVYDTVNGWIEYYDSYGIQTLDNYIAINKKIEECFIDKYAIIPEKISVIYPAVDDVKIRTEKEIPVDRKQICEKYGLDADKKHYCYVGRLTNQKNPLRFCRLAMEILKRDNCVEFVIVGDGELSSEVEQFISANELQGKIIRLPYVANVPELYKVMDGLIILSNYEGMPIVSIEAMSMGVPVFGTDVGDLRIFVEKYESGLIIPVEEEDDVSAFDKWLKNYDLYKENMVKHAQENLDFFSASTLARLYVEIFERESKDKGLLSVVIPSYNHEAFIGKAIESVLNQTYKNLELIIVDDGSTDSSVEMIQSYKDSRIQFVSQENQGAHNAINRGLSLAKGKYLAILNSDDIFEKNRFEILIDRVEKENLGLVCSYLAVIDDHGKNLGIKEAWKNMEPWLVPNPDLSFKKDNDFVENLLMANFISTTSNFLFTRSLYDQIGGMRNLRFAHDWDYALRAAQVSKCEVVSVPLMRYRIHGSNTISSNRKWMLFEIVWIWAANLYRFMGEGAVISDSSDFFTLVESLNLQGNDKLFWMLCLFFDSQRRLGVEKPEELLLQDASLREKFIQYVVE